MDEMKLPSVSGQYRPDPDERWKLAEQLKKDRLIQRLLKQKEIPEAEILKSTYVFKRYRQDIEACLSCESLSDCRQKRRGFHPGLSYDGILKETLEACRYRQTLDQKTAHLRNYLVCDLSEEFQTISFDEIDLSRESRDYVASVVALSDLCYEEKGAYIYGNMGTGKTYLAACAANYVTRSGKKAAFVHSPAFFDRVNATMFSGEYRVETERCRFADLLVIDDIGAEAVNERGRMVLLSILDARMQNHKMTWFTSNADFEMLRGHLRHTSKGDDSAAADRIIERIRALATPVYLAGDDRRHLY